MEIEKKFLVKKIPENLSEYVCVQIEQAYVSRKPTIRIRKWDQEYVLTVKTKYGVKEKEKILVNQEMEMKLSKEEFDELLLKADGNMIRKKRYLIPLADGRMAELDRFEGKLNGLVFVEVEFESVEEAEVFSPPEWFGKDVSFDKRYCNIELSKVEKYKEENYT